MPLTLNGQAAPTGLLFHNVRVREKPVFSILCQVDEVVDARVKQGSHFGRGFIGLPVTGVMPAARQVLNNPVAVGHGVVGAVRLCSSSV